MWVIIFILIFFIACVVFRERTENTDNLFIFLLIVVTFLLVRELAKEIIFV